MNHDQRTSKDRPDAGSADPSIDPSISRQILLLLMLLLHVDLLPLSSALTAIVMRDEGDTPAAWTDALLSTRVTTPWVFPNILGFLTLDFLKTLGFSYFA